MRIGRFDLRLPLLVSILLSSSAAFGQTRYSMNVVGYYDAQFVAGSNLVANPFDAGNNTISNLFAGLPVGSVYLPSISGIGFGPTNQFAGAVGWTDGAAVLDRRAAGFLCLPAPANVSFAGEAWPTTCISFPPGMTVSGIVPKYACGICFGCQVPTEDSSQILRWDRVRQRWDTADYYINVGWLPELPTLAPDEAAVVFNAGPRFMMARSFGLPSLGQVPLMSPKVMGTNIVFEFSSYEGVPYVVQRSANLAADNWRTVLTNTTTTAGAYIQVTVPMEGESAFYRLHALRLLNPVRTTGQFQFQFYGEQGIHYRVSRSPSFENPTWQLVTEIDGTGSMMTATDSGASARGAYYRLEY